LVDYRWRCSVTEAGLGNCVRHALLSNLACLCASTHLEAS
jgi:hypothetical protein